MIQQLNLKTKQSIEFEELKKDLEQFINHLAKVSSNIQARTSKSKSLIDYLLSTIEKNTYANFSDIRMKNDLKTPIKQKEVIAEIEKIKQQIQSNMQVLENICK